jgi:hypothetical protein
MRMFICLRCWLICIAIACIYTPIFAQNAPNPNPDSGIYAKNLQTYWEYRQRFLGTDSAGAWIRIGEGAGFSLPMAARHPYLDCNSHWLITASGCHQHGGYGLMEWGDATVYLGYYTLMLALEYRNLEDAGQPTQATARELYYALKAYNRLDLAAELKLGMQEGIPNGFFVRDDVPWDFYKDAKTDKHHFERETGGDYACLRSDGSCEAKKGVRNGGFVSQDQALSLMLGFLAIQELIPNAVYEKFPNEPLAELAQLYTDRIVHYMIACRWRLKAPNGERIPNLWGGDIRAMNYPMARLAKRITKDRFRATYQTGLSKGLGRLIYSTYDWAFWLQSDNNRDLIFPAVILAGGWNNKKMNRRTHKTDKMVYGLMYAALNHQPAPEKFDRKGLEAWLAAAPPHNPCWNTPNCKAPEGWRSYDRWFHNELKNGGGEMIFSGLDYLYTYNLYHYLYKKDLPAYIKR